LTEPPTHVYFKALGHPLRLALIYFMLKKGPLEKAEAYEMALHILPNTTLDQVDRQLRTLLSYSIVERVPRPTRGKPGRSPNVFDLTPHSRSFYSRLMACLASGGPVSEAPLLRSEEGGLGKLLYMVEVSCYLYPGSIDPEVAGVIKSLVDMVRLVRPSRKRVMVTRLDCSDAKLLMGHPIFRLLIKRIPPSKLERIGRASMVAGHGVNGNIVNMVGSRKDVEECRKTVTEFLQGVFDYLVMVEGVDREALELLFLDTVMWRRPFH